ncbi:hypothetical protein [Marinigracilibium pacificum]|uniref:Uncharacterized protein n=1 Tax=Marinigracilibium pacificum TaxID=2729599 RepID=A0A848IUE3_9BACT|nr:hypothetical protein [Marinigracilibium pacificum]NMM46831.1 hypothetical protein [Marinigracilibium pacificum]
MDNKQLFVIDRVASMGFFITLIIYMNYKSLTALLIATYVLLVTSIVTKFFLFKRSGQKVYLLFAFLYLALVAAVFYFK